MIKKILLPVSIFIILLVAMYTFQYVPLKIFNIDISLFSENMKILYSFCCDLGFMIILFFLYKDILIKDFKKYFKNFQNSFETSFKYYFIGVIIMIASNLIISLFFNEASANNENLIRDLLKLYPTYMIFSVSIYAPFTEELIFRKSIKDSVISYKNNKFTKYLYILISGLIFGSLHVVGMINSYYDYLYLIPYSSLGIAFASLYYKTDNIFSSISMHAMHNTFSIILLFLVGV